MFADFKADGQVLKLEIQSNIAYPYMLLGVVKKGQEHFAHTVDFNTRQGIHYYDLRFLDEWEGEIKYLATNLDKRTIRRSRLVEPTLIEELCILLDRELFSSKSVNHTKLKTFLGFPLTQLLFFFAVFLTLAIHFLGKKTLPVSIFISCLISSFLLDSRILLQHFRVVQQIEYQYPYINPMVEAQRFLEAVKPMLKEGTWTYQSDMVDEYIYLFFKYNLADIPFLKNDLERYPTGTYIITVMPPKRNQKIVFAKNGFNLLQQL